MDEYTTERSYFKHDKIELEMWEDIRNLKCDLDVAADIKKIYIQDTKPKTEVDLQYKTANIDFTYEQGGSQNRNVSHTTNMLMNKRNADVRNKDDKSMPVDQLLGNENYKQHFSEESSKSCGNADDSMCMVVTNNKRSKDGQKKFKSKPVRGSNKFKQSAVKHNEAKATLQVTRKVYCCENCKKTFKNQNNLLRHKVKCSFGDLGKKSDNIIQNDSATLQKPKIIIKRTKGKTQIRVDVKSSTKQSNMSGFLICLICQKHITTVGMPRHLRIHAGRDGASHICETCGRCFIDKCDYIEHMNSHRNIKPHLCSHCGLTYSRAYVLKCHIARAHKGLSSDIFQKRTHQCEICDVLFYSLGNLTRHQIDVHGPPAEQRPNNSIPTYKCDQCGRVFGRKYVLQKHIARKHAHSKEFACDICNKTFVTNEYLQTHTKRHLTGRLKVEEKPFKCNLCYRSYGEKYRLKAHMKKHNNA